MKSAQIADHIAELYIQDQIEMKFRATEKATKWLANQVGLLERELIDSEDALKRFKNDSDLVNSDTLSLLSKQLKDFRQRDADFSEQVAALAARMKGLRQALAVRAADARMCLPRPLPPPAPSGTAP